VLSPVEEAIALVVKLRPCDNHGGRCQPQYADFMSSFMQWKDLTRADFEAALQIKQTERDTHRGPLLSPSGDAALRTTASPPRQNKPGVKCACYKKERARKDANGAKPRRANRPATPSSLSPAPPDSAKVTELAASASVRLANSPDTHADEHWIADTGATSHMSPRRS
jgi:hypothetical protein